MLLMVRVDRKADMARSACHQGAGEGTRYDDEGGNADRQLSPSTRPGSARLGCVLDGVGPVVSRSHYDPLPMRLDTSLPGSLPKQAWHNGPPPADPVHGGLQRPAAVHGFPWRSAGIRGGVLADRDDDVSSARQAFRPSWTLGQRIVISGSRACGFRRWPLAAVALSTADTGTPAWTRRGHGVGRHASGLTQPRDLPPNPTCATAATPIKSELPGQSPQAR
jgi:hypothetical protein